MNDVIGQYTILHILFIIILFSIFNQADID